MSTRREVLKLGAAAAAVAFVGPLAAPKSGWALEAEFGLSSLHREERLDVLMTELKRIIETAEPGRTMRYQMYRAVAAAFPDELFIWSIGPTLPVSHGHHFLIVRIAPGAANSIAGLASVYRRDALITMKQQLCSDCLDHESIITS